MPVNRRKWILGVGCLVASGCASTDATNRMARMFTGRQAATSDVAIQADASIDASGTESASPADGSDVFRLAAIRTDEELPPQIGVEELLPQPSAEELPLGQSELNSPQDPKSRKQTAAAETATDDARDLDSKDKDADKKDADTKSTDDDDSEKDESDEDTDDEDSGEDSEDDELLRLLSAPRLAGLGDQTDGLPLQQVIASVQGFFPLLEIALLERDRTAGDQLAAWGEFDTKLKARTENQSLGFYENYQHGAGVVQPLYRGGEVYGGYRTGRGVFEPWYQERQTNEGGEFKAGFQVPLMRDKAIDARRADLWRATYDRQLAEPIIRIEVINAIREASITYWFWVAAGQQVQIGEAALQFAARRNSQVSRRVEEGDLGPPALTDNRRAILERESKLIDLQRKRIQTAIKLSLFLRDPTTAPRIPDESELPAFPEIAAYDVSQLQSDIAYATRMRPELVALDTELRRVQVDFAEARNETLPILDAFSNVSQDLGEPTSDKRDKSELEWEIGLEFELPVQQRKGFGKMRSARAKMGQIENKRQFAVEKISTEVASATAALDAAYRRVDQITQAVEAAEELAQVERTKFKLGESDLLAVFLREQIAIEAASELVFAKLEYFIARADYTAALAYEFPVMFTAEGVAAAP